MSIFRRIFGIALPMTFAHAYDPRGGKFEVYGGPLDGQFLGYTGEVFRADESGPFAQAFADHEYRLRCDEYSERLYYTWSKREKK